LNAQKANLNRTAVLTDVAAGLKEFVVPSASERNFFVVPECLAAVKAFLESPHAEAKTYAIVDVGAGTTEVSFFFNGRIMAEQGQQLRPSYLADSTQPVGGLQIHLELARAWNCNLAVARGPSTRTARVPLR
jgi:hypothetical protein